MAYQSRQQHFPKSQADQIEQYSDIIERNVDETANSAMSQL
jgi:hypothetical protein